MRAFWKWARDHDGHSLFHHLEPYPEAVESLWKLIKARHQVVIITTKPPWAIHDTFAWIAHHQIPTREVHIIEQKWTVDCDIYLDDGPHVLRGLVERRPDRIICRFVRPWNDPVKNAVDVDSWPAFLDLVGRSNPLHQR